MTKSDHGLVFHLVEDFVHGQHVLMLGCGTIPDNTPLVVLVDDRLVARVVLLQVRLVDHSRDFIFLLADAAHARAIGNFKVIGCHLLILVIMLFVCSSIGIVVFISTKRHLDYRAMTIF